MKKSNYVNCKSWSCNTCKNYYQFLTVSTQQGICWNKKAFYEKGRALNYKGLKWKTFIYEWI